MYVAQVGIVSTWTVHVRKATIWSESASWVGANRFKLYSLTYTTGAVIKRPKWTNLMLQLESTPCWLIPPLYSNSEEQYTAQIMPSNLYSIHARGLDYESASPGKSGSNFFQQFPAAKHRLFSSVQRIRFNSNKPYLLKNDWGNYFVYFSFSNSKPARM